MFFLIVTLFSALWDTPHSAIVTWYQTERTCLWYQAPQARRVALECYDQPNATITVSIGAVGPLDGAYRPVAGGVYILETDQDVEYSTKLVSKQYFPIFTH